MQYDEVLQATLLLSCYFNKSEVKSVKPLTPTEYARFASWLHKEGLTPANLLHDLDDVMKQWGDPKNKITADRVEALFSRGASMGFALENWAKHGIWVVSRASKQYPRKIREKIGDIRPPILFGVGNQELLNKKGIGFVGSRSIDTYDEAFATTKAELAISQGYAVVSGGAKGIDQTAMIAALKCGGESVGILADSLLKASASKAYREGLRDNKLALVSPFYPEAGFSPGNAMARNKYIYAMSESVVVVKSDYDKGGTWSGAKENLKKQWVPLLVRSSNHQGNKELIKLGGIEITEDFNDFNALPRSDEKSEPVKEPQSTSNDTALIEMGDLFATPTNSEIGEALVETNSSEKEVVSEKESNRTINSEIIDSASSLVGQNITPEKENLNEPSLGNEPGLFDNIESATQMSSEDDENEVASSKLFDNYGSIFQLFYSNVVEVCEREKSVTPTQLLETYPELTDALIKKWLKLLEERGLFNQERQEAHLYINGRK